jgi:predicted transcriptional regulator
MTTTTIRLPEALKTRIANVAALAETTAHNFILEAIAEKTTQAEQRNAFLAEANTRYATVLTTGKVVTKAEMKRYVLAKAKNKSTAKPATTSFSKA